jgi:hypothetical protein
MVQRGGFRPFVACVWHGRQPLTRRNVVSLAKKSGGIRAPVVSRDRQPPPPLAVGFRSYSSTRVLIRPRRPGGGVRSRLEVHDVYPPPSPRLCVSCRSGTQLQRSTDRVPPRRSRAPPRSPACRHTPRTNDSATHLDREWRGGRAGACDQCAPVLWHTAPPHIPDISSPLQTAGGVDDKREGSDSRPPYRLFVRQRDDGRAAPDPRELPADRGPRARGGRAEDRK